MNPSSVLILLLILMSTVSCNNKTTDERTRFFPTSEEAVEQPPARQNVWVFLMAGQSNMAGRGLVEPQDTISDSRILTINQAGKLIVAKEPLHFYEPSLTGLDCGLSFGKALLSHIPDSVSILLIPTAVGGSSISQWLGDSVHRDVKLLTNFKEKVALAQEYGQIKAILWHQGESDANATDVSHYKERIAQLVATFREITRQPVLPILLGELGTYSDDKALWTQINAQIHAYSKTDSATAVILTGDLKDKGDHIHFDSESQRTLGQRYASAYLKTGL